MNSTEVSKKVNEVIECFEHKDRVKRVGVFGSVARGEATAESDVDLLIDINYDNYSNDNPYAAIEKSYKLNALLRETFSPIEMTLLNLSALIESGDIVMQNEISKDVVWVYEK